MVRAESWPGISMETATSTLAVGQYSGQGFSVFYGNGDGTFQPGISYSQFPSAISMVAGDFNGDGKTDLAATFNNPSTPAAVFLGGAVPDLTVSISPGSGFTQGQIGASYSLLVLNVGQVPTNAAVGVADSLPSGFTVTSMSGSGWTCVMSTVACTRSDSLAAGAGYPPIRLMVNVSSSLTGNVTDNASVSGGGDQNSSNNSASLTSFVRNSSSVTLASSPNPSTLGQAVTLTATVSPGAIGRMTFYDGTSILGNAQISGNQASLTTGLLSSGTRSLTAGWGGNATYGPSVSTIHTQNVGETAIDGLQLSKGYKTDGASNWVAIGDFNGDGKPDLVTANSAGDVSILLGNGDGTFQPAVNYTAASNAYSVVIGDFNGDGKSDLALGGNQGIYILIGNGDGSFQAPVTYAANTSVNALVVADFNGDGIADLAAATGSGLFIAFGTANGTFETPLYTGFSGYVVLQVADFNQDGTPDLLFGQGGQTASIAFGNGDGTFQSPINLTFSTSPYAYVIGDFNNDGKPDLAITYFNGVQVFLNQGNGVFSSPIQSSLTSPSGYFAVAGDFDGDGKLDVAIRGYYSSYFNIAFGNGDGTFTSGATFNTAGYASGNIGNIAVGDFNLDGKPDFAVANPSTFNSPVLGVDVFLGGQFSGLSITSSHTGTFTAGQQGATYQITVSNPAYASSVSLLSVTDTLPTGLTATAIAGNGWTCTLSTLTCTRSDTLSTGNSFPIITVTVNVSSSLSPSTVNNQASVTSNTITNTATDPTEIVAMTTTTLVVSPGAATLGQAVILTATVAGGGTGRVTFRDSATILGSAIMVGSQATFTTYLLPTGARSLSAFYQGDSTHGISSSTTSSLFVSAAAASGFATALTDSTGSGPMGMALGDFNGDGKVDLVTANWSAGNVSVLIGNGDGSFHTHADYNVGTIPVAVAVGDFNSDGKQDLAVVNQNGTSLSILLGNGNGTFQSAVSYATGNGPSAVAIGDFNGDGIADVAVSNGGDGTLSVFFGIGNGTFQPAKVTSAVYSVTSLTVADFNNDGKADLLTGGQNPYVLLGNGDGTFTQSYVCCVNGPTTAGLLKSYNTDIVAGSSNSVLVFLGSGTGIYSASTSYPLTFTPTAITLADVNGDGLADVIAAGGGSLAILLGEGRWNAATRGDLLLHFHALGSAGCGLQRRCPHRPGNREQRGRRFRCTWACSSRC